MQRGRNTGAPTTVHKRGWLCALPSLPSQLCAAAFWKNWDDKTAEGTITVDWTDPALSSGLNLALGLILLCYPCVMRAWYMCVLNVHVCVRMRMCKYAHVLPVLQQPPVQLLP